MALTFTFVLGSLSFSSGSEGLVECSLSPEGEHFFLLPEEDVCIESEWFSGMLVTPSCGKNCRKKKKHGRPSCTGKVGGAS